MLEASAIQQRHAVGLPHPAITYGSRACICERPGVVDAFAPKASLGTVFGMSLQTPLAYWVFCRGSIITTGSVQPAGLSEEEMRWARIELERSCEDPVHVIDRTLEEEVVAQAAPPFEVPSSTVALLSCPACRGQNVLTPGYGGNV